MPEELEVSSSLEQGQFVQSFLYKRHCAAPTQYGSVAGKTLARQIFLTPTASPFSTTSTRLPPPEGIEGKKYNCQLWGKLARILDPRIFLRACSVFFSLPILFFCPFFFFLNTHSNLAYTVHELLSCCFTDYCKPRQAELCCPSSSAAPLQVQRHHRAEPDISYAAEQPKDFKQAPGGEEGRTDGTSGEITLRLLGSPLRRGFDFKTHLIYSS